MSTAILGFGWLTAHGASLEGVTQAVMEGAIAEPVLLPGLSSENSLCCLRAPEADLAGVERIPRLRRASTISHLSMAAALAALADAGLSSDATDCRLALLFAASDGSVVYTRRFFADLVERGTQAGSPLLFPETVYNAPASHIAAKLGICGTTSTVVGDSTAALHAIAMAEDLLATGECTHCLVVAAEELDWVVTEAYGTWGLGRRGKPIFSEAAAAIVLGMDGEHSLAVDVGRNYASRSEAKIALKASFGTLPIQTLPAMVFGSGSGAEPGCGPWFDACERAAILENFGEIEQIHPRLSLGEAFAASTLAQIILAARLSTCSNPTLVSVLGWNGQCGSALLERMPR
ncbi:MAG: beta-ketoacyl synthase N-terminal-like domain-containing protein [Chthoniobacterales bacterium]